MICNFCGNQNPEGLPNCKFCGNPLPVYSQVTPPVAYGAAQHASYIPAEYKPLSPWAYFGYQVLFSIPLVGFIMLIVFSCGGTSNVNLKNYARSHWIMYLLILVLTIFFTILGFSIVENLAYSLY